MQRFILQENIRGFRERIAETSDQREQGRLKAMLAAVERELALLESEQRGVGLPPPRPGAAENLAQARAAFIEEFVREFAGSRQLAILIDPGPGLQVVDVNRAAGVSTGLTREGVIGQPLFLTFPENPAHATADGVAKFYASLRHVAATGRPHALPVQRYDVRDATGAFVERYWRVVNSPLHDDAGQLVLLLQIFDEVTDTVLGRRRGDS